MGGWLDSYISRSSLLYGVHGLLAGDTAAKLAAKFAKELAERESKGEALYISNASSGGERRRTPRLTM
jgi:hypothetical protein